MANVTFMFNNEDRKKINKNPATLFSAECIFKEDTSLFSPTMIISKAAAGGQWAQANYAYIEDFGGRFYFIDNIIAETGGKLAYHMTVDPLKTYASDLMGTSFFIARSESINSKYFLDTEKALEVKKIIDYREPLGNITQSQTGNKYCLTVAGGM